ncbi:MAG TPA: class I SAM-dependent methyltransferase [Gaiellaceae bacterium]
MTDSLPPLPLVDRVGRVTGQATPAYDLYGEIGRALRQQVLDMLPEGWSFEGKRVLDFGCGAGRVIRHFGREAQQAEFVGCDIDARSVAWAATHLAPPFRFFENDEWPPLALGEESVDLAYAFSVFTHLTENWSSWIIELHRVLRPGGLLLATFLNVDLAVEYGEEPWDEDRIGMNVIRRGSPWDMGGPIVFHSRWWIEEHWGRAFEVLEIHPSAGTVDRPIGQGCALLRKKDVALSTEMLERISPEEPREIRALQHNIARLHQEEIALRAGYESARSWRLTRPLRKAAETLRQRRSR